ncbi:hypothetical protein BpHYR1_023710 [Brachionus plicatilis]|uniref:Uncharacterized protein n=1 Tax=Brachionus plicatilis TaxID=10195 RepID=A0A3M7RTL2_BRAPC|nr:hypothetical protein BpHYR1_023710 [Brachionus plicatilis]
MFLFGCILNWILILHYAIRLSLAKLFRAIQNGMAFFSLSSVKTMLKTLLYLFKLQNYLRFKNSFKEYQMMQQTDDINFGVIIGICIDAVLELGAAIIVIVANAYCTGYSTIQPISDFDYAYLEIIGAVLLLVFALILLLVAGVVFFMRKKKKESMMINNFKPIIMGGTPSSLNQSILPKTADSNQGFWTPLTKNEDHIKITENTENNEMKDEVKNYPSKPKKLTPIFSRKRAEIAKFPDYDEPENVENLDTEKNDEIKLNVEDLNENLNEKNESEEFPGRLKSVPIAKEVKEIPKNPFDFIWGLNSIAPFESDSDLKLSRKNTTIGGRVDKLSINPDTFSLNGLISEKENKTKKKKSVKKKDSNNTEAKQEKDELPFDFNITINSPKAKYSIEKERPRILKILKFLLNSLAPNKLNI